MKEGKSNIIDFKRIKEVKDKQKEAASKPARVIRDAEEAILNEIFHTPDGPKKEDLFRKYRELMGQENENKDEE